jgi:diguanylate cyclase (GGDEF)-like protein
LRFLFIGASVDWQEVSRILLLIKNRQIRETLETGLTKSHAIIEEDSDEAIESDFDLGVVDGPMLKRFRSRIKKAREAQEPVFLPFLLTTIRRKGSIPIHNLGRLVDDVIVKPIDRDELKARVANLLRRRFLSVELKKEHDRVARLSVTDDVSGFQNTRYLHRYLDKFFDSPKAVDRKLSLAFFDIDSFKGVVDTHGHLLGAKVLREIAQAVNRTLDADDRIVRYGGDEYVVILPDQDKEDAAAKVEKMREAIKESSFLQKEGCYVRVTASFGLATSPDDGITPEDLLGAADECLFKSKRNGKDRITTMTASQPYDGLATPCEQLEISEPV